MGKCAFNIRGKYIIEFIAQLFLDLAAKGLLNLKGLVTHRFPYQQASEAYPTALGERGPALGVVFEWPKED